MTRFNMSGVARQAGIALAALLLAGWAIPAIAVDLPGTAWYLGGETTIKLSAKGQSEQATGYEYADLVFSAGGTPQAGACVFTNYAIAATVVMPCTFTATPPKKPTGKTKFVLALEDDPLRAAMESELRNQLGDPGIAVSLESKPAKGKVDPSGIMDLKVTWKGNIYYPSYGVNIKLSINSGLSGAELRVMGASVEVPPGAGELGEQMASILKRLLE